MEADRGDPIGEPYEDGGTEAGGEGDPHLRGYWLGVLGDDKGPMSAGRQGVRPGDPGCRGSLSAIT